MKQGDIEMFDKGQTVGICGVKTISQNRSNEEYKGYADEAGIDGGLEN